jgi:hypothetical protein
MCFGDFASDWAWVEAFAMIADNAALLVEARI